MLIGLHGKMQVGKDTIYLMLKQIFPEAERIGFADKLKQSAAAALGTSVEVLERLKVTPDWKLHLGCYSTMPSGEEWHELKDLITPISIREFLQYYGTEAHREIFGPNFWVEQALPKSTRNKLVVVTDCRFESEALAIRHLATHRGEVIKITRPIENSDSHASEQELPERMIDYYLENDGTLDDLKNKVENLADWIVTESKKNRETLEVS